MTPSHYPPQVMNDFNMRSREDSGVECPIQSELDRRAITNRSDEHPRRNARFRSVPRVFPGESCPVTLVTNEVEDTMRYFPFILVCTILILSRRTFGGCPFHRMSRAETLHQQSATSFNDSDYRAEFEHKRVRRDSFIGGLTSYVK